MLHIREDLGIFLSILLYHAYILYVNTASLHGLYIPNVQIWTGVLLIPILFFSYLLLAPKAESVYEQALYIAIVIGIGGTTLRIFGFGTTLVSYSFLVLIMAILTAFGVWELKHQRFQVYFALLVVSIAFFISSQYFLDLSTEYVGPLLEVLIVGGIIYYNLSFKQDADEFFFIIIFTLFGYFLGNFITGLDVAPLIISTVFEQTLNVNQYSISDFLSPQFFFSLHMAEVFNIFALQIFKGRSWSANALIFAGMDITYPPLAAFRAMAVLVMVRHLRGTDQSNRSSEELYPTDEKEKPIDNT